MAGSKSIFDLVIAGAGPSGLALAASIKQAMGSGVSVALVDPSLAPVANGRKLRSVARVTVAPTPAPTIHCA